MKCIVFLFVIFSLPVFSYADTYSWIDSSGGMHFTENIESVPAKYRKKALANAREGMKYTEGSFIREEQYKESAARQEQVDMELRRKRQQARDELTRKDLAEQKRVMDELNRAQEQKRYLEELSIQQSRELRQKEQAAQQNKNAERCIHFCGTLLGVCIGNCSENTFCINRCANDRDKCVSKCYQ